MQLDVPLKELFDCSVAQLKTALPPPSDKLWDVAEDRRNKHAVHNETRSIVFKWLDNGWTPGTSPIVADFDYAPKALARHANAFASKVVAHFGGRVVKLMLAELRPGASIVPHRDVAPALHMAHRCHLPIVTNASVDFSIDGVAYQLKAGKAYEFDNTRVHSVANRGLATRVHLICDVMPL
jgi:aspartyl/asparaginyl beta-hydroxylase (cupin superfamily)